MSVAARVAILLALLGIAACSQEPTTQPTSSARGAPVHLVEVQTAQPALSTSAHERTGSLRFRRFARIFNQEEGRILEFPWFEGDRVAAGELLLRLDDALLAAELAKAQATTRQAREDLKRIQNLAQKRVAAQEELARSRTTLDVARAEQSALETRLGYTRLVAPFVGVITERLVEPGDVVARNTHLLTLADPNSLITEVQVSELLLPRLAEADPVGIRIDALGDTEFSGRVLRIHPALDEATRQGVVEVALDPVPQGARAGQFVRVRFETAAEQRLLVPFTALQQDRRGEYLFVVDSDTKAQRVPVRSGLRVAGRVEILDGLEPGQRVIVRGFLGLDAGKRVTVVSGAATPTGDDS